MTWLDLHPYSIALRLSTDVVITRPGFHIDRVEIRCQTSQGTTTPAFSLVAGERNFGVLVGSNDVVYLRYPGQTADKYVTLVGFVEGYDYDPAIPQPTPRLTAIELLARCNAIPTNTQYDQRSLATPTPFLILGACAGTWNFAVVSRGGAGIFHVVVSRSKTSEWPTVVRVGANFDPTPAEHDQIELALKEGGRHLWGLTEGQFAISEFKLWTGAYTAAGQDLCNGTGLPGPPCSSNADCAEGWFCDSGFCDPTYCATRDTTYSTCPTSGCGGQPCHICFNRNPVQSGSAPANGWDNNGMIALGTNGWSSNWAYFARAGSFGHEAGHYFFGLASPGSANWGREEYHDEHCRVPGGAFTDNFCRVGGADGGVACPQGETCAVGPLHDLCGHTVMSRFVDNRYRFFCSNFDHTDDVVTAEGQPPPAWLISDHDSNWASLFNDGHVLDQVSTVTPDGHNYRFHPFAVILGSLFRVTRM